MNEGKMNLQNELLVEENYREIFKYLNYYKTKRNYQAWNCSAQWKTNAHPN